MITKVAQLYHAKGLRQADIAERLGLSQARVSRLLAAARDEGIVVSVVVPPAGLFTSLERELEDKFGLSQVHVVDNNGENEDELRYSLGVALTGIFQVLPLEGKSIGFTSWSRSLRSFVQELQPLTRVKAAKVVELLGGVGSPALQNSATSATERLAMLTHSNPFFLRVPGVTNSIEHMSEIVKPHSHSGKTLAEFSSLDIALIGVGDAGSSAYAHDDTNFFTSAQFEMARAQGAIGEINLRFIDAHGVPVVTEADNQVVGISLSQLRNVPLKLGICGGAGKRQATLAVARGKWADVLVTDIESAQFLLDN
jgi:DNA-binding transcriptional regulator LsrR (DeoR family)